MTKRENSRDEHYKKIIQKQKSMIKSLKKELGRADKLIDRCEDLEVELLEELLKEESPPPANKCPECGKGILELLDLKARKIYICNYCRHRIIKK